ncbi:hypothetical protein LJ207_01625 [Halanaerobium sp. Z-7514]|uniref:Copper amine oxidase-like N-terminal domain-containing protein n=1 Tax=Halanaerobium polyolivorans TaxID=2886943 RepID=A0AAW4WYL1_9FIRM|nr:hypothetical protein [Halanaerobium polyolivorans]MCC3144022.1 hypothetical protein [Halanaerobium polyolivorans]RQD71119.1 MAG: hypothetical protein D5S01_10010 [Halanaerobium sp. MSAO_Bac5]
MKKILLILTSFLLIFLTIIVLNTVAVEAVELEFSEKHFMIMPDELEQSTLFVVEELTDELDINLYQLEEERFLLISGGRFYLLNANSNVIETEAGNYEMPAQTMLVNNKLLAPLYIIELLAGLELSEYGVITAE